MSSVKHLIAVLFYYPHIFFWIRGPPWSSGSALDSESRVELSILLWNKFYKRFTSLAQVVPGPIQPWQRKELAKNTSTSYLACKPLWIYCHEILHSPICHLLPHVHSFPDHGLMSSHAIYTSFINLYSLLNDLHFINVYYFITFPVQTLSGSYPVVLWCPQNARCIT